MREGLVAAAALGNEVETLRSRIRELEAELARHRSFAEPELPRFLRQANLLESIEDGFAALDADWRFTYLNRKAEEFLHRKAESLIGRNFWEEYPALLGTESERTCRRVMAERTVGRSEEFFAPLNEWFEGRYFPSPDGGILAFFTTITQRKKSEEALRRSEERWRSLANAIPQFVWVALSLENALFINDYWYEYTGLPIGDLSQAGWADVLHPEDLPRIAEMWEQAVASGSERSFEYRVRRASDGMWRWHLGFHRPERDGSGAIVRWIGTGFEIHELKLAQEALRATEERFRGVFESSAIGAAILTLQGQFMQVNRAFCQITGYSEEELCVIDSASITHPDDRVEGRALIARLISGELPRFVREERYSTRDGRIIWVNNSMSLMRDTQGHPAYLIALCEDIGARKQAEADLRESEERFRAIFETTPECVKLVAADGTLLHINSSGLAMVGAASAEAVAGNSVYKLLAPEFRDAYRRFHEGICAGEKGSLEFDIFNLNGSRRHMETHAAPLHRPDGTVTQLAITRDITERKRAERASLLLAEIVGSSHDAIISEDLKGIMTSWNRAAERLFGYTAAEAVGQPITLLIPPDRMGEEIEIVSRLQRGERIEHFETVRRRKNGAMVDVSLTVSPIRDEQGRVIGASKIARDISDRKRAEKAIKALNAQLTLDLSALSRMQQLSTRLLQADNFAHLLDEIVQAGIEITGADMGNIQLLENGVLKIVSHRGFEEPFLDFFNWPHDGAAACGTALQRGERVIVDDVSRSPIFAGTGALEVMLAAGALAVQSTPLVTRSGHILGMFSTHYRQPYRPGDHELRLLDLLARQAADLIERKRAEAALLASEARFRQLADSMPQMVWTARPDGYLDYYNERWYEFTGIPRDRFGDSSWQPVLHPDDVPRCHETWYASVRSGEPYGIECRFRDRKENRWRWFMGRALAVRDGDGQIVKWFGTCTDIDEQKRVEDELRRANQDLEQFAYSASHDLQEPLRSIKIYGELLTKRYSDSLDGEAFEFLGYLRSGASRMEMLVRDLLAYTQVTRLDTPTEPADAGEALNAALASLSGAIGESGASVTRDPLPAAVAIHRTHLSQLFQNLVGNAIKYRRDDAKPEVHVTARREGDGWQFSVSDNGIGIDPEYNALIFGLFKRLNASDGYSGTGIGLALCERIVERYDGRIWVESEPGNGSTFHFTLPA